MRGRAKLHYLQQEIKATPKVFPFPVVTHTLYQGAWEWHKRYQGLSLNTQVLATKTSQIAPTQPPPLLFCWTASWAYLATAGQIDQGASHDNNQNAAAGAGALGPINLDPVGHFQTHT